MTSKKTRVDVVGREIIIQFSQADIKKAIDCIQSNGIFKYRFSELRIRDFPSDMSFEPHSKSSKISRTASDDGGDGDSDGGDGGGGGYDID